MRMLATVIGLTGVLVCSVAQAAPAPANPTDSCRAEARRLVLSGEALVDFMQKCTAGQMSLAPAAANPQQRCAAGAWLLSGEEKVNFDRTCNGK